MIDLLVGFGQTICLPVGRKCGDCKLADRGLCPGAVVAKLNKKETVLKMEAIPKVEVKDAGTVSPVKQEVQQVMKEVSIKAEDINDITTAVDIEDIGLR